MENKKNCLICGEKIKYSDKSVDMTCVYCKKTFTAGAVCKNNHYVCDSCHSQSAFEIINTYCEQSDSVNPFELTLSLMKHPSVKMHGPEHHFLIPAVLLTCYANSTGNKAELKEKLAEAQKRAKNILGGFCGFYGCCGAAVGAGVFMSIATNATPLAINEWRLANLITSDVLREIANNGGPRCCKRNTFIALNVASAFVKEHLNVTIEDMPYVKCDYSNMNKDCKGVDCKFYTL